MSEQSEHNPDVSTEAGARAAELTELLAGAPAPTDHEGVRKYLHALARAGCAPLLVFPGTKQPFDGRTVRQRNADDQSARDAARAAGRRNWDKVTGPAGVHLATSDTDVLDGYLDEYIRKLGAAVAANVGVSAGRSRLVIMDCDTAEEVAAFLAEAGEPEGAEPTVRSPGAKDVQGSWIHRDCGHLYFVVPADVELPAEVDSFADPDGGYSVFWGPGKYVLAPPSVRREGPYEAAGPVQVAPAWLIEKIISRAARAPRVADRTATSSLAAPIDAWSRAIGWEEILAPVGWTPTGQFDSCGCETWTAPGPHASPKSATAHEPGCAEPRYDTDNPPMHIWTDNPGAPFGRYISDRNTKTLSKLQAVALIDFDNKMGDAMEVLNLIPDGTIGGSPTDGAEQDRGDGQGTRDDPETIGVDTGLEVTYPPEFWEARESLRHLRDAALARRTAPDAVLAAVLAQLSSRMPPGVRVDTGIMSPLPLNLFAGLVSRTGKGKTSALNSSADVVSFQLSWPMDPYTVPGQDDEDSDCPVRWALGDDFPRPGKVRSGEGIAEMYYGKVQQPNPRNGNPRTVRARVRSNALMTTDEGAGLIKHILDDRSTVGETLREAWSGSAIGQSNADEEKYRHVPAKTYSIGMIVGFQLSSLAELLVAEQLELGTPQRFLCAWSRPDRRVASAEHMAALVDPGPLSISVPSVGLRLCDTLRGKVDAAHMAAWLSDDVEGEGEDSIESQKVAMLARLAALLAIMDHRSEADETGRLVVTEEDWRLAEVMFQTSCAITRLAIDDRRSKRAKSKRDSRVTELAESIEDEDARATPAGRAAARILGYLTTAGPGPQRWSGKKGIRARFNSGQTTDADAALEQLVDDGKVRRHTDDNGGVFIEVIR